MSEEETEEYTENEEYQDNYLDEQRELWEEQTGSDYPSARRPDSLFSLFRSVWRTSDSTKVANLDPKSELGNLNISVRDAQKIGYVANMLGHNEVGKYFKKIAEITLATSMSKKGWFPELFVTSKKFAHKGTLSNLKQGDKKSGWRIFGNNQSQNNEEA